MGSYSFLRMLASKSATTVNGWVIVVAQSRNGRPKALFPYFLMQNKYLPQRLYGRKDVKMPPQG
ncbi:hypothetical protein EFA69_13395 [Rufibacter immobilis]|uniref:Uncharacterized protein n=1 Tax=Rufibacter immobilis TaxID=1348778 RepID=A0A3M9MR28_9BACT|nr:hypothetical protein EFA69_13395 [Rufibacter immobilis]